MTTSFFWYIAVQSWIFSRKLKTFLYDYVL